MPALAGNRMRARIEHGLSGAGWRAAQELPPRAASSRCPPTPRGRLATDFIRLFGTKWACRSGRAKNPIFRRSPRWGGGAWKLAAPCPWKQAGAAPDRAGVGGCGKRSGGGLPTRPRRLTGLGGRAFVPRRFWPRRFWPAGRTAPRWSWPNRGVVLLPRGEGGCFRLDRGGGCRKVPRDREDRLDETLDQMDQQRGQPIPAAVGGQALGDSRRTVRRTARWRLGGMGWGVHATKLVLMTFGVKRDCAAVTIRHVGLEACWRRGDRACLADRRAAASMSPSKTQAVNVCSIRWSGWGHVGFSPAVYAKRCARSHSGKLTC